MHQRAYGATNHCQQIGGAHIDKAKYRLAVAGCAAATMTCTERSAGPVRCHRRPQACGCDMGVDARRRSCTNLLMLTGQSPTRVGTLTASRKFAVPCRRSRWAGLMSGFAQRGRARRPVPCAIPGSRPSRERRCGWCTWCHGCRMRWRRVTTQRRREPARRICRALAVAWQSTGRGCLQGGKGLRATGSVAPRERLVRARHSRKTPCVPRWLQAARRTPSA